LSQVNADLRFPDWEIYQHPFFWNIYEAVQ